MEWLALSIVFVATIYFAIHYPAFRRTLIFVAVGSIGLAVTGAAYLWHDNWRTEERRQNASKLISSQQIQIEGLALSLGPYSTKLTGTVVNKSEFELSELAIKVLVYDCPRISFDDLIPSESRPEAGSADTKPWERYKKAQEDSHCGVVGEGVARASSINVPKGQKRAFEEYVSLPRLPDMKEWSWSYSVEETIAKY
jgi:hypothetical protein